jgi:hypothetical protein
LGQPAVAGLEHGAGLRPGGDVLGELRIVHRHLVLAQLGDEPAQVTDQLIGRFGSVQASGKAVNDGGGVEFPRFAAWRAQPDLAVGGGLSWLPLV